MTDKKDAPDIRIEDLYPGHSPEWYAEAEYNVRRYLNVITRIAERLQREGKTAKDLDDMDRL